MHTFEQLHSAAKIIRADGVEGIQSASSLVGRDVALGMLILFLREIHNENRGWPDLEDTEEKVNEILQQEGLLSVFQYSPSSGQGIVHDGNDATHIVTVEKMYEPESAEGVHLGMWLQGPDDYRIIPAGPPPFRKAYDEMSRAHEEIREALLRGAETHP